ncbi:MAG TPA: OB-fold domain-containing protein [Candidatus Omnitrophota bacterium]|nr:OB-fold domain-containing protein [Candidatus Omnitrophota bacterium]HPD84041.1 OB-fold domain-containing protein [Candidatus Omnitrophota bacterium]HRZ02898.1 OB-fold domain-containing protein [Candidatus Omnitrophota bacterium]
MIVKISGKLVEKKENSLTVNVQGLFYEVVVPPSVLQRIEDTIDVNGNINLVTYHYLQIDPSRGFPVLIGFLNEVEKDFFGQFITVSGIGPRAAVKALNKPISQIARAIDEGDLNFLRTLPGIGEQRAKEIVAKLQGKVGKFGLIQDKAGVSARVESAPGWQEEALSVLLQLQYKRQEALEMIKKALERSKDINTTEGLLNEIYKQKVKK